MTNTNASTSLPRLLVVSHVIPLNGSSGQQLRVLNKLLGFRKQFEVTFLTFTDAANVEAVQKGLEEIVAHAIVLPTKAHGNPIARALHKFRAKRYAAANGVKESNYFIGEVELSTGRIREAIQGRTFDLAVYEYWHAYKSVPYLQSLGIPCILDMHDLLWQSFKRALEHDASISAQDRDARVERYKAAEERAWKTFDAIIAINRAEQDYLHALDPALKTFYAPMGTDLDAWGFDWTPAEPMRLAYYGGLSNRYNQHDALICYEQIMPKVWERFPDAQLWLVGSGPPESLKSLADGKRVFVTGFVERVQDVLKTMSLVLCPFNGTFGFRSRLIEVMALGVPVVASEDAAYGMDLPSGEGIFLSTTADAMTQQTLRLLEDTEELHRQSNLARRKMEELYSFEQSYDRLATELVVYISERSAVQ